MFLLASFIVWFLPSNESCRPFCSQSLYLLMRLSFFRFFEDSKTQRSIPGVSSDVGSSVRSISNKFDSIPFKWSSKLVCRYTWRAKLIFWFNNHTWRSSFPSTGAMVLESEDVYLIIKCRLIMKFCEEFIEYIHMFWLCDSMLG